jgi:hypothetical protein
VFFLDENGDGQIEAAVIEAALRRLHKDLKGMAELRQLRLRAQQANEKEAFGNQRIVLRVAMYIIWGIHRISNHEIKQQQILTEIKRLNVCGVEVGGWGGRGVTPPTPRYPCVSA